MELSTVAQRGLSALQGSLHRDGWLATAAKVPRLVRYGLHLVRAAEYYRHFHAVEREEGFDARWGTDTSALVETFELSLRGEHAKHAVRYEPAHVGEVRQALASLPADATQFTLVDLGSGKGRALMVAADFGFQKLIGVELSPALDAIARSNVARFHAAGGPGTFELRCGDAADFEPPPGPVTYFLFNPFSAPVLEAVLRRLGASLVRDPRDAALIYLCPSHRELVEATGLFRVWHEEPRFLVFRHQAG